MRKITFPIHANRLYKMVVYNANKVWKRDYILFCPQKSYLHKIPNEIMCYFYIDLNGGYKENNTIGTSEAVFTDKLNISDILELKTVLKSSENYMYNRKLQTILYYKEMEEL